MMETIASLVTAGFILTLLLTVYFSLKSRRSQEPRRRGLLQARMNISMGFMLIFLSLIQMTMFSGSTIRVIVGSLFMVIGVFNLVAGLRNHSHFNTRSQ